MTNAAGQARVKPRFTTAPHVSDSIATPDGPPQVFCVRFSPDDKFLASSTSTGAIRIYNTQSGNLEYNLNEGPGKMPTTQVRWRPELPTSKTKNVLVTVNAEEKGEIQHWHAKSGKKLHEIGMDNNPLFCVDYSNDASMFAVAGRGCPGQDRSIHVFDEATKREYCVLTGGDQIKTAGHSNRVFSLKFHPTDKNLMVTGGWDNTVQLWDMRKGHSVQSIFGVYICGDGVDIAQDGQRLLTASYRARDPLQIWDIRNLPRNEPARPRVDIDQFGQQNRKLVDDKPVPHTVVPWSNPMEKNSTCNLYCAQFSRHDNSQMFISGGSSENEAKIFQKTGDSYSAFGSVTGLGKPCFTVDFSNNGKMVAVSGGDGKIRVMDVMV